MERKSKYRKNDLTDLAPSFSLLQVCAHPVTTAANPAHELESRVEKENKNRRTRANATN